MSKIKAGRLAWQHDPSCNIARLMEDTIIITSRRWKIKPKEVGINVKHRMAKDY